MTWSTKARQFATVFRREAQRTGMVREQMLFGGEQKMFASQHVVPLEQAAAADMKGYEDWAAAAVQRYADRHGWPSWPTLAGLACSLCRSPMSEVAWVERALGDGVEPDRDGYDQLARRFRCVRPFPRHTGMLNMGSAAWAGEVARRARIRGQLGLLLADEPWLIPSDVAGDPAYRGPIPEADMWGRTVDWDRDGLGKRVDHEMLVLEAAFDEGAKRELTRGDGQLVRRLRAADQALLASVGPAATGRWSRGRGGPATQIAVAAATPHQDSPDPEPTQEGRCRRLVYGGQHLPV